MGVITKPSSVQRSVIVRLLVSCGMAVGSGHTRPPAVASRGSILQTRPPAQGAAYAAADPERTQKTGDFSTPTVYLLYLSTLFLWLQAVAGIIGVTSSNALRRNSHIPSDLVVDLWASDGERRSLRDFLFLHDV